MKLGHKDDLLYVFFQSQHKNSILNNQFFIASLYNTIYNKYAFISLNDIEYQNHMNLREKILRPVEWHLKSNHDFFNMRILDEVSLSFNSSQPFFFKAIFQYFINPLFKLAHSGQLTELYDPTREILSDYEFESLEFSDFSFSDFDEMMLRAPNKPELTYWYNYRPILTTHASANSNIKYLLNHNKIQGYPFYEPYMFDFLKRNFETYFALENLFLAKKDIYQRFTYYSFKSNVPWNKTLMINNLAFTYKFYRYFALGIYDVLKLQNDPYLSHYKLIRKNEFIFLNYENILVYPIFKYARQSQRTKNS